MKPLLIVAEERKDTEQTVNSDRMLEMMLGAEIGDFWEMMVVENTESEHNTIRASVRLQVVKSTK